MDVKARIERALSAMVESGMGTSNPPRLSAAIRYALFPPGARLRPRLCLGVAGACGDDRPDLTDAGAAAIEMLHCASLIHDDMPCFDDAATRRGKPSLHCAFDEPLALLAGDALIVLAFQTLARAASVAPDRLAAMLTVIGDAVGMPHGIVAGQAWEGEVDPDLACYHRAKSGALFAGSTMAGAAAAGYDPAPWATLGLRLGEAYQVIDDIRDVTGDAAALGKPTGQDAALDRPNAVDELGLDGAVARFDKLVAEGLDSMPACPGRAALRVLILAETDRFLPKDQATA
ncbi:MAG: polyprenyl synthetase family protein [Rhizobiales bacterium]|nr:polyprenyl synthetase family protein [Hyphomicrobiales bacterium]